MQHLKYNIYTLKKARGLKLPTLTNWDLVFHILCSIWFYLQPFSSYKLQKVTYHQGRSTPYLRPVTIFALFWRRFGVEHVVVYVRVASLFAQAEIKQSQ